jgi:2-octaprenyl-6-methoxyphenol hydroxylase
MTKKPQSLHYDIVIVGGGLVGTLFAIALRDSPWRVALIEAYLPAQHQQATEDMRSIALSEASQKIFESLGLWQNIASHATTIEKIHVSEQKRFGKALLDAKALGLPPFGYVIPIPFLYQTLQESLEKHQEKLTVYRPAVVKDISKKDNHWQLEIDDQKNHQHIQTTLVIAADGDRSFIRQSLHLPIADKTVYQQTAIVTSVLASKSHQNTAYERFTPRGTIAILPLQKNRVAIIWTVPDKYVEQLSENLLVETQAAIGYRLGKFSDIGKIQRYPLKEMHADVQTLPGLFLLGNAAHVLHPIAAQGLNLSLRDAAVLAELLQQTSDLCCPTLSETYIKTRAPDQQQTERFTDHLVKLFTPQFLPLSLLRSLGLLAFDLIPPAKRAFCLKRMGVY